MTSRSDLLGQIERLRQRADRNKPEQPELDFGGTETPPASLDTSVDAAKRERSKLLPVRHVDRDFFLCDMFDYALKDDGVSMEAPIFTLSTKPDTSTWSWTSRDGNRHVEVYPSVKGRATQFDKDVLIYVVSQMTEGLNRGRADAKSRVVRFVVYDYGYFCPSPKNVKLAHKHLI